MKLGMRYGSWKLQHRCSNCHRTLTNRQRMHNQGLCPFCGFRRHDAGTVVETCVRAVRVKYDFWFIPIRTEVREYPDDPV